MKIKRRLTSLSLLGGVILTFLASVLLVVSSQAEIHSYRKALPGYQYRFPNDHASHPAFKTEWWYYTGHLQGDNGAQYGYELTFFRVGTGITPVKNSQWSLDTVYLAHFAVSDIRGQQFYSKEIWGRPGLKRAGARVDRYEVWNHQWHVRQLKDGSMEIQAQMPEASLQLMLKSQKPPIIHGRDGVSQKADCVGCASHYYSMTRMDTVGTLRLKGEADQSVKGITWMDHEFGSNQLTSAQTGWDWFSVQLDNNQELMLYQLRQKQGPFKQEQIDPNSSGTFINASGKAVHLSRDDFRIRVLKHWKSAKTQANYPSQWRVDIPKLALTLDIKPLLEDQELSFDRGTQAVGRPAYWEGACRVQGKYLNAGKALTGKAYVELTGYARPLNGAF